MYNTLFWGKGGGGRTGKVPWPLSANFTTAAVLFFFPHYSDCRRAGSCWSPPRWLRQIGLDGVAITESRHRMWLLSLLWVEKGKGRRHLALTWNRGQLMIQFREAFLLSLRLGIFAAASQVVSNRHHSPSPTAQSSLSGLTSRAMLGSAVAHFTCVTCVRAHSSVPPLLCIRSMIMQHATRAI